MRGFFGGKHVAVLRQNQIDDQILRLAVVQVAADEQAQIFCRFVGGGFDVFFGTNQTADAFRNFLRFRFDGREIVRAGGQGILAGIMFGYVVGKLFLLSGEFWSKVEGREGADQQLPGSFRMLLPLFLALAFAIILNFAGSCLFKNGISQSQEMKAATSSFPSILWLGLLTSVGTWCGLFGPYTSSSFFDEASATKNLNYALAHHGDLTGVPYKLTTYSTYFTYAQLAGLGLLLALMFVSKRRNRRLLCWWCLIPVFFGYDSALNIGTPVLLNPLFLIPYVFVPQL